MSTSQIPGGRTLGAILIVMFGLAAGEVLSPEPAVAGGCNFQQCFAEAGGDECQADVMETNCEWGISTCSTTACGGGDGGPTQE